MLGEAPGDLVQEKDFGLDGEGPSQFEALALQEAEGLGQHVRAGQQGRAVQSPCAQLVGGLLRLAPAVGGPHQHVLEHGHALERLGDLIGAAQAGVATLIGRPARDVLAGEHDRPAVGMHDAGEEVEHGGLARAVGADDPERLPLDEGDAQVVDHAHAADTTS